MKDDLNLTSLSFEDKKDKLLAATNKQELEKIIDLFNLDITKKNIIRSSVYSDMIDQVIKEVGARLEKYPGQFSNKELLEYMTALQNNLDKPQITKDQVATIAIQQNNIINLDPLTSFSRESKDKMRDALRLILASKNQGDIIEDESTQDDYGIGGGIQSEDLSIQDAESERDDLG